MPVLETGAVKSVGVRIPRGPPKFQLRACPPGGRQSHKLEPKGKVGSIPHAPQPN